MRLLPLLALLATLTTSRPVDAQESEWALGPVVRRHWFGEDLNPSLAYGLRGWHASGNRFLYLEGSFQRTRQHPASDCQNDDCQTRTKPVSFINGAVGWQRRLAAIADGVISVVGGGGIVRSRRTTDLKALARPAVTSVHYGIEVRSIILLTAGLNTQAYLEGVSTAIMSGCQDVHIGVCPEWRLGVGIGVAISLPRPP